MTPPEEAHKSHSKKVQPSLAEILATSAGAANVPYLQAILDAVPDAVAVFDRELHLVQSNAAHRAALERFYAQEPPTEYHERVQATGAVFFDAAGAPEPPERWPAQR